MVRGEQALDLTAPAEGIESVLDLVRQGKTASGIAARAEWLARTLHRRPIAWASLLAAPARRVPHLLLPIEPPEVWSVLSHAPGSRPGFAFKGIAARCVGSQAALGMRHDAGRTVAGACLAAVLGPAGGVVGYTACLDLTAVDLAALGPAYESQARCYAASAALGPALVTSDELAGPREVQVSFRLIRDGKAGFEGRARSVLPGDFEELSGWLLRDNILVGGTAIAVPVGWLGADGEGLRAGDRLEMEIEGIGRLASPVRRLGDGPGARGDSPPAA